MSDFLIFLIFRTDLMTYKRFIVFRDIVFLAKNLELNASINFTSYIYFCVFILIFLVCFYVLRHLKLVPNFMVPGYHSFSVVRSKIPVVSEQNKICAL